MRIVHVGPDGGEPALELAAGDEAVAARASNARKRSEASTCRRFRASFSSHTPPSSQAAPPPGEPAGAARSGVRSDEGPAPSAGRRCRIKSIGELAGEPPSAAAERALSCCCCCGGCGCSGWKGCRSCCAGWYSAGSSVAPPSTSCCSICRWPRRSAATTAVAPSRSARFRSEHEQLQRAQLPAQHGHQRRRRAARAHGSVDVGAVVAQQLHGAAVLGLGAGAGRGRRATVSARRSGAPAASRPERAREAGRGARGREAARGRSGSRPQAVRRPPSPARASAAA